eukprot:s9935_g3.t1
MVVVVVMQDSLPGPVLAQQRHLVYSNCNYAGGAGAQSGKGSTRLKWGEFKHGFARGPSRAIHACFSTLSPTFAAACCSLK